LYIVNLEVVRVVDFHVKIIIEGYIAEFETKFSHYFSQVEEEFQKGAFGRMVKEIVTYAEMVLVKRDYDKNLCLVVVYGESKRMNS